MAKINNETEYTVCYRSMGGVDFTSENNPDGNHRFAYLENMYRDYDGDGGLMLESVPGFRKIAALGSKEHIHAIFSYKDNYKNDQLVIHSGSRLYKIPLKEKDNPTSGHLPIAYLEDRKSTAFSFENSLYVLDGCDITVVDGEGVASSVLKGECEPYVPTCYLNGEEYEQRNLLTDEFYERYGIGDSDEIATESPELIYEIISKEDKTCAVSGVSMSAWKPIYIPSKTTIGGESYSVIEVLDNALLNTEQLTALTIANGVKKIGRNAFRNCIHLESVVLPDSITEIGRSAFCSSTLLSYLYLGKGVTKIGEDFVLRCPLLADIEYGGTADDLGKIEMTLPEGISIRSEIKNTAVTVSIPVFSPAEKIELVTVDGKAHDFSVVYQNYLASEVIIFDNDKSRLNGKEVVINGIMSDSRFRKNTSGTSFMAEYSIPGRDAILGCTLAESFDGRIFLSGNPDLPNTVFYSQRDKGGKNNPLYFGILNYFNDGVGTHAVSALLASGDSILVFKDGEDKSGTIYYHRGLETGIDILPKVYPVSHIHNGISAVGEAISFFDEPIFLSRLGVVAARENGYTGKREIEIRSHNVNPKLLCESLSDTRLGVWLGYLVVASGEHIYLGDPRQRFHHASGSNEYEWYFLSGIGSYQKESRIYRYSETASDDLLVSDTPDEIARGQIGSYGAGPIEKLTYYSEENGKRYAVYLTDEYTGGEICPLCALYSNGELLIFGTENGEIFIFNNDKRGVPPPRISQRVGFSLSDYEKSFKRKIHPDYYSFGGRAARYVIKTVMDNVGIPHLTKSTVKNSLVAKMKLFAKSDVGFEIKTDKGDYVELSKIPDTVLDFEDIDFGSISFVNSDYSSIAIREKEKGWIEKQLQIKSEKFCAPFGLCSLAYRYTIKGRIKNG